MGDGGAFPDQADIYIYIAIIFPFPKAQTLGVSYCSTFPLLFQVGYKTLAPAAPFLGQH